MFLQGKEQLFPTCISHTWLKHCSNNWSVVIITFPSSRNPEDTLITAPTNRSWAGASALQGVTLREVVTRTIKLPLVLCSNAATLLADEWERVRPYTSKYKGVCVLTVAGACFKVREIEVSLYGSLTFHSRRCRTCPKHSPRSISNLPYWQGFASERFTRPQECF